MARILRVLLPGVLLAIVLVPAALGDSIDPKVIVGGGGDAIPISGNTFHFFVNNNGGGFFNFIAPQNGEDIFSLALTFAAPTTDLSQYQCSSPFFPSCGFSLTGNGSTVTVLFSGGAEDELEIIDDAEEVLNGLFGTALDQNETNGGIEEGQLFTIDLGTSGWVAGSQVTGILNPVPEPGTLALLLTGLGLLGVSRRRLWPKR